MFDCQIIPKFGITATDEPATELIQHVKMICDLSKRTDIKQILTARQYSHHVITSK